MLEDGSLRGPSLIALLPNLFKGAPPPPIVLPQPALDVFCAWCAARACRCAA
jgi:hypothetical protein